MAEAPFRIMGPVFVYTSNILNYAGDKLERERERYVSGVLARVERRRESAVAAGGGDTKDKLWIFFYSVCRNTRRYESGLMMVTKTKQN